MTNRELIWAKSLLGLFLILSLYALSIACIWALVEMGWR